jgi:spectinomycin phosphotransferase
VTGDDLDTKPWLGTDRDTVFGGLLDAYGAAVDLRTSGLGFVVAPVPNDGGAPAVRLDDRYALCVFEHVDGDPGRWGRPFARPVREAVVATLGSLHASPYPSPRLRRPGLAVPGRSGLDDALRDVDDAWDAGPLSEPARQELATHGDAVVGWLADLDRRAARHAGADDAVITHGEPHPGNLLSTATGLVLIDWDTVALAPPERDLWMLVDADSDAIDQYGDTTGVALNREALAAYRRLWALTDVAAFTALLRGPHRSNADAAHALEGLRRILAGREPAPYGAALG